MTLTRVALAGLLLACAGQAAAQQELCATSFDVVDKGRPVVSLTLNGTPVRFLVDTGAAFTMLSAGTAKSIGIRSDYTSIRTAGIGGRGSRLQLARNAEIQLAGTPIERVPLYVSDFDLAILGETSSSRPVGVLGADWMRILQVSIDYRTGRVQLPCTRPNNSSKPTPLRGAA